MEKNLEKTRTKDSLKAFEKLTEVVDGEPRIVSDPPLIVPIAELAGPIGPRTSHEALRNLIRQYRRTLSGTAGVCSSGSVSSTPPGRWSASAASAPGPGSS